MTLSLLTTGVQWGLILFEKTKKRAFALAFMYLSIGELHTHCRISTSFPMSRLRIVDVAQ